MQIFIVDNDTDDQDIIRMALREFMPEASLVSFYDGSEIIQYASEEKPVPDLIFMDLNMPCVEGEKAVQTLRTIPKYIRVPIVFLSTSRTLQHGRSYQELGANGFFTKPSSLRGFQNVFEQALKSLSVNQR